MDGLTMIDTNALFNSLTGPQLRSRVVHLIQQLQDQRRFVAAISCATDCLLSEDERQLKDRLWAWGHILRNRGSMQTNWITRNGRACPVIVPAGWSYSKSGVWCPSCGPQRERMLPLCERAGALPGSCDQCNKKLELT